MGAQASGGISGSSGSSSAISSACGDEATYELRSCGEPRAVGTYVANGIRNGRPLYELVQDYHAKVYWIDSVDGGEWCLYIEDYQRSATLYTCAIRSSKMPAGQNWLAVHGKAPAPFVCHHEKDTHVEHPKLHAWHAPALNEVKARLQAGPSPRMQAYLPNFSRSGNAPQQTVLPGQEPRPPELPAPGLSFRGASPGTQSSSDKSDNDCDDRRVTCERAQGVSFGDDITDNASNGRLPLLMMAYLAETGKRLARGEPVVPCELSTCSEAHGGEGDGELKCFCSEAHQQEWLESGLKRLRNSNGDILREWEYLDVDFTLDHCQKAGISLPPAQELRACIERRAAKSTGIYRETLLGCRLGRDDEQALRSFEASGAVWPPKLTPKKMLERCLQPKDAETLAGTYCAGVRRYEKLYLVSAALARTAATTHPVAFSVKRPYRLLAKHALVTGARGIDGLAANGFRRVTDVFRTSIVLDTISQVEVICEVLRGLGRDSPDKSRSLAQLGLSGFSDYTVERIANRFIKPGVGGYMDVLVKLRVDGYVCEVQLHLGRLLCVGRDSARQACKWMRRYTASPTLAAPSTKAPARCQAIGEEASIEAKPPLQQLGNALLCSEAVGVRDLLVLQDPLVPEDPPRKSGDSPPGSSNDYEGPLRHGLMHGEGSLRFASGNIYRGQFRHDMMHGGGTLLFTSGNRYDGEMQYDMMHGQGVLCLGDGESYDGCFQNDLRHGLATSKTANGDRYDGEYTDGEMHGRGTFCTASGDVYEGEFRHDRIRGFGAFTSREGERYAGEWRDGRKHGRGAYAFQSGAVELSVYDRGEAQGEGVLYSADRSQAWLVTDGVQGHGISLADAAAIMVELGFPTTAGP